MIPPDFTTLQSYSAGDPFTYLILEQMIRDESRKRIPRLRWYQMFGGSKLRTYQLEVERHQELENQCNILWNSLCVRLMKLQVNRTLYPLEQQLQEQYDLANLKRQRDFFEQVTKVQIKQQQDHEVRMLKLQQNFQLRLLEATPDKTDPAYIAGRRREAYGVYTDMIAEVMNNPDLTNEEKRRDVKLIFEMASK